MGCRNCCGGGCGEVVRVVDREVEREREGGCLIVTSAEFSEEQQLEGGRQE